MDGVSGSTSAAPTPRRPWWRRTGSRRSPSAPFEVWRDRDALGRRSPVVARLDVPGAPVALTTTAELSTCSRPSGRVWLTVLDAAEDALPGRELRVFTTAGELVPVGTARERPLEVRRRQLACERDAGRALAARRDPRRLRRHDDRLIPIVAGEVARAGAPTSNGCSTASSSTPARCGPTSRRSCLAVPIGGEPCPVTAELFAIAPTPTCCAAG